MVLDLAPICPVPEEILMLMSRAITTLTVIINRSSTTANNDPIFMPYKNSDGILFTMHQLVLAYFGNVEPIVVTYSEIDLD